MAALGFFRKNQKLVFVIMVFLMVLFLVTIGGTSQLSALFSPKRENVVIGKTAKGEIVQKALNDAEQDIHILGDYLHLGSYLRILALPPGAVPGEEGFFFLSQLPQNNNPRLAWALLLQDARDRGMKVGDQAVSDFLLHVGLNQEGMEQLLTATRRDNLTEQAIRQAVADYLLIDQAFGAVSEQLNVSEPAVRELFRNQNEKLGIAMVEFSAKPYLAQVSEPTEAQVLKQFDELKTQTPGAADNPNPFKFGYRQPQRAQVEYVLVRYNDILASAQPDEDSMIRYWNAHRGELTKEVPASTTAPSTQAGSQPSTQMVEVPITDFSEAKGKIRDILATQAAQRRLEEVTNALTMAIRKSGENSNDAMDAAARKMLESGVKVEHRLTGPMTREQLHADPILGSANTGGGQQAQTLDDIAFSVAEFHQNEKTPALTKVGELYNQSMELPAPERGKLLWRVASVNVGGVPEKMTDEIRQQVVSDIKQQESYEMALAQARKAMEVARKQSLAEAAALSGLKVQELEPLPRKVLINNMAPNTLLGEVRYMAQGVWRWIVGGQKGERPQGLNVPPRLYVQTAMLPPMLQRAPEVPGVEPAQADSFVKQMYALVTEQYELEQTTPHPVGTETAPSAGATSAPAPSDSLKVIELPAQGSAYLAQRVKFVPAYEETYKAQRLGYIGQSAMMQRYKLMVEWYSQPNIIERTGYKGEKEENLRGAAPQRPVSPDVD